MKKIFFTLMLCAVFAATVFAAQMDTYPNLGTPATTADFVQVWDNDSTLGPAKAPFVADNTKFFDGTGAFDTVKAVEVPITDTGSIITATEVEGALQENRTAIDLNTAKETNTDDQTAAEVEMSEIGTATYDSVQDWANNTQSAGIVSGGLITDSGSGEIDVSAAKGYVKSTNSEIGASLSFDLAGEVDQSLTDGSINYIAIDYNSGTPQYRIDVTSQANGRTIFNRGKVYREGTDLDILNSGLNVYDFAKRVQQHHVEEAALHFTSGSVVGESGTLNVTYTAGVMYAGLNRIPTPAIDTSGAATCEYYYYDGDAGPAVWVESDESAIDNAQYNDVATGLTNLTTNRYSVAWAYDGTNSNCYWVYGQGDYLLSGAQAAQPPASLPVHIDEMGVLRAKIIVRQGVSSFIEIEQESGQFESHTPANHNELGGLDGGTAGEYYHLTASDYGYVVGVTSDIQTQLDAKEGTLTNSAGLLAALDDKTGTDLAVFNNEPVIKGKVDRTGTAVNDDDCTGEQGSWWWDSTDTQFEWCNENSGTPTVLGAGGGYTNLTQFVDQTAWVLFYSDTAGDVTELVLGADGTYLMSNGAAVPPTFETPSGAGDVVGPASSVDNTLVIFDSTTGKLIKAGTGCTIASGTLTCTDIVITNSADFPAMVDLPDNSVDLADMTDDSVDSAEIIDGAVDFAHLSAGAKFQSLQVSDLSDTTTPSVLTAAETTNKVISNYKSSGADHVFTMPAAHAAGNVIFQTGDEFQIDIEPASGTALYLNGTAAASDEHLVNDSDTVLERMVCYCPYVNGAYVWACYSSDNYAEATP